MRSRRNDSWMPPSRSRGGHSTGRRRGGSSFGRFIAMGVLLAVLAIAGGVFQLLRPIPRPSLNTSFHYPSVVPGVRPSIPWPTMGAGTVEVPGVGILGSFGANQQIAIASVAKMMTAYIIVTDHPLQLGQTGPNVTLTAADYQTYQQQLAAGDSVAAVAPGEVLNEYQLLEALLIPSADNIAITLANWDAGSVPAFVAKMNAVAHKLGMNSTRYTDPSGLNSNTVSTPADQLKIAQLVESNPVLSAITALPQATLPVSGVVYNVNYDLGSNGIVGIKTGSTPSGGNFAFAANVSTAVAPEKVIGVILGQQGTQPLITALDAAKTVAGAVGAIPQSKTVVHAGQVVASLTSPGRAPVNLVAGSAVTVQLWPGLNASVSYSLSDHQYPIAKGARAGTMIVRVGLQSKSVPLMTAGTVKAPSISWRLKRL